MNLQAIRIITTLFLTFIIGSVAAQPYFDRDGAYSPQRRSYLAESYGLSSEQLSRYETALAEKATQSHRFFDTPRPRKEWIAGHIDLCKQFQAKVQQILTPAQFEKWKTDNRNSDQIRRYRENLNLSDDALTHLLQIIEQGKVQMRAIAAQKTPETEKKSLQRAVLTKRDRALRNLVGEPYGSELIRHIDLEDKAAFVRTYFPQFSYNLSYVVGQIYLDFTYANRAAEWSEKDAKTKTAEKHEAHKKLLQTMKSALNAEQYAQWHEYHFHYHDNYTRYTHSMGPAQFEIYKDVMNSRAVGRLLVAKSNIAGDLKTMQLDSIDLVTYEALSMRVSPECAEMWRKNANIRQ